MPSEMVKIDCIRGSNVKRWVLGSERVHARQGSAKGILVSSCPMFRAEGLPDTPGSRTATEPALCGPCSVHTNPKCVCPSLPGDFTLTLSLETPPQCLSTNAEIIFHVSVLNSDPLASSWYP